MLMKNNIKQKLITAPLFLMSFHKLNYERGTEARQRWNVSNKIYERKTEAKQISPFF